MDASRVGIAAVTAAVAVVAAVAAARAGHSRPAEPRFGNIPLQYRVVYRVSAGRSVSTEQLWVRRPFEAEDDVFPGPSASGTPASVVITGLGAQRSRAGTEAAVIAPAPRPTPYDVRLDAVATAAVADHSLDLRGTRVIASRRCRVFRTATSLASGTLAGRPTDDEHVDTCVDDRGLLLDEVHVAGGHVTQERRAIAVDVGPAAAHTFDATSGTHLSVQQGGGAVVRLTDDSRPPGVAFYELGDDAGFTHVGRYAVVAPRMPSAPGRQAALDTAIDDVYVRGVDVVVVENASGSPGASRRLGALTSSVTVSRERGVVVRIIGTIPPDRLTAMAHHLRSRPPGTITTAGSVSR